MDDFNNQKDGGWGWVVVFASFFINFIMDGVRYSFGLLYIELLVHFDANKGTVGMIGGIMFGLWLIVAPMSGFLINKFGCRLITISGSCLVCFGFFCSAFATGIVFLYVTLGVLGGVGFSMLFMAFYVAIVQWFDKYRSLAIGLAVAGSGVGGFAFSPLTNFLIERYSWRGTLMIISGILFNGCVCGAVMRPVQKGQTDESTENVSCDENQPERTPMLDKDNQNFKEMKNTLDGAAAEERIKPAVNNTHDETVENAVKRIPSGYGSRLKAFLLKTFRFTLLIDKLFLLFVVVEICINISVMVPFLYVPDMAMERFEHITRMELVWLPNAMSIANVASRIPVGILADRRLVSNINLMGILCVLAGLSCLLMPFCASYSLLVVSCVCYSAGIVSAMVLIPVVLSELFGDDVIADSFGLSLFFGGVSGLIGTPLAGLLFDVTGSYELTFIMAGVEFALGGLILFIMAAIRNRFLKS